MKKIITILSSFLLVFAFATTAMADITTVVSDIGVSVYGPLDHYSAIDSSDWGVSKSAVITWKHPSWPTITGATWISSAYSTEIPRPDSWRLFSDVIELPSCATNIAGNIISVTSDNAEEVYLNGDLIGSDGEVQGTAHDDQEWNTIKEYSLTGLHAGTNELKIIVRNYAYNTDSPTVNPTGLIYRADITYTDLSEENSDGDVVNDCVDKCPNTDTGTDQLTESLGTNRWIWDGDSWETVKPKGTGPTFRPDMAYTYGCSCTQILDSMAGTTGFDFDGHYKYGCSKSILEDWNRGDYYVGPTFIETVEVPANLSTGASSITMLEIGKNYFLKAYGTGMACDQPGCIINFDAEYSTSDGGLTWVDGVAAPYDSYGLDLLDLKVDGTFVDWETYNPLHTYQIPYAGTGNPLSLVIYDLAGSYFNDSGSLFVDIIEDKWVDLW